MVKHVNDGYFKMSLVNIVAMEYIWYDFDWN